MEQKFKQLNWALQTNYGMDIVSRIFSYCHLARAVFKF